MTQLVELQQGYERLKALGAAVLVIGIDGPRAWDRAARGHRITLRILTDEGGAVAKAYGVLGLPSTMHHDRPGHTFVIVDRDGTRQWTKDVFDMGLVPTSAIVKELERVRTFRGGK